MVLAHLRRRWSLRGREGFGFLSPSRWDCEARFNAFVEVKRLFFTVPEAKKRRRKEVTRWPDARPDAGPDAVSAWPARPVSGNSCAWHGALGFATSVSDHSRDRRIRSCTQESSAEGGLIGRGGTSGHMRPDASGRQSRSLEPLWIATGHWHYRVRSWRGARPVTRYLRA
jgi:hypothetical protein